MATSIMALLVYLLLPTSSPPVTSLFFIDTSQGDATVRTNLLIIFMAFALLYSLLLFTIRTPCFYQWLVATFFY